MIKGAQLSNSFIILMALNESKEPVSTTEISRTIALYNGGPIYKFASTLTDSLENRLEHEGYVQGVDINGKKSLYSLHQKARDCWKDGLVF